ncbi:MAG: DUF4352 domain-containing protein [Chloroflexi bacterium]|nr:DUF4352 domain-containing protein [Chloroflexota bacterium]
MHSNLHNNLWKMIAFASLLLVFATACQVTIPEALTPVAEREPTVTAAPTAVPQGQTRSNPLPGHEAITFKNWEVEIIETVQGEKAWHVLLAANQFNDPPFEGWEYLLVRYRIRNISNDPDEESLGLHITGDANRIHFSFDYSAVTPDPSLETYLAGGVESEGWEAYHIRTGQEDLMVVVDDLSDFDSDYHFIALEEGNRITVNTDLLNSLTPTEVGTDPNEPARVGQVVTSDDWQISILESYSGDEAWKRIFEANQFNDQLPSGMMFVLVKMRMRYIGQNESGVNVSIYSDTFALLDGEGIAHDMPQTVEPEPDLDGYLFPGGEIEGWLALQVPEETFNGSRLLFQPQTNLVDNLRYLSLVDYGR